MADSTMSDLNKLKVVELRKELKTRGLPTNGDKSELVARLQAAMSQDDHGDINLDSDEIDSDGVLEDEDDKSQTDILDDAAVDTLSEELALSDPPKPAAEENKSTHKPAFKRKITSDSKAKTDEKTGDKEPVAKKIVLNRATSITTPAKPADDDKEKEKTESKSEVSTESNKVKITADVDPMTKLELRAKRFGLPVQMSDNERKEARMKRFGQTTGHTAITASGGSLSENLDKLKQRADRFGQSVSKIMTDIENKEKLEKRKAKFGTAT